MQLRGSSRAKGFALIIIADLLWGTVFVASQVGLKYMSPYDLVFLRFLVASLAILPLWIVFNASLSLSNAIKSKWTWFFALVYSIGFIFQYVGQDLTTASEATLLTNLSPIIVPIFAFLLLREPISNFQKASFLIGLLGLFFIASPRFGLGQLQLAGDLILFLTSVSYALFTVMSKKKRLESLSSIFAVILCTSLLLAFPAIFFGDGPQRLSGIDPAGWLAIVYLGIPCTLIAITLYLKGLDKVKASEAAIFFLLQVQVGLILSALLFGEYLSAAQIIGVIAVFIALLLGIARSR
ncbi:MAG: DMT family transporter [Candidatus Methanomethylicia archaeon]|nr:DMT family transporter [Candidatus Methanomethylicia archaeon]